MKQKGKQAQMQKNCKQIKSSRKIVLEYNFIYNLKKSKDTNAV